MRGWKMFIVGAAVLALAGTACSSSASSNSSGGATATASAAATASPAAASTGSGSAVTVAVMCSCSGPFGTFITPEEDAALAWVKHVNASGGVDGHQVKVLTYDDAGNVGKAVTEAQSAIAAKPDVILDLSLYDAVWAKAVDAAKIPVVGGELNTSLFATDPNFYPSGQTPDSNGYSLVEVAKDAGAKKLAEFYCVEAPSCASLVAPMAGIGTSLGVPSVYKGSIAETAPNYTAECLAAKDAGADAIAIADVSVAIIKAGTSCTQQSYNPIYVTAGGGYTPSMSKAPGIGANLWTAYATLPIFSTAAPVKQMEQIVQSYYPGLETSTAWSQVAAQGWTGALLIGAAVQAAPAGAITATSITTGLNSLKNETLDGWSPPLTFTAGQPHKVDCWFTGDVTNDTPKVADGGKYTCMPGS